MLRVYDLRVGITLDQPVSSTAPSHSEPPTLDTTCAAATPHTNSMSCALTITKSTPPHTSPPLTLQTERTPPGSAVDTTSEASSDMESSSSLSKLPQPTQVRVRLIIINVIFKRRCGKAGMHDKGPVSFPYPPHL